MRSQISLEVWEKKKKKTTRKMPVENEYEIVRLKDNIDSKRETELLNDPQTFFI